MTIAIDLEKDQKRVYGNELVREYVIYGYNF